jgi:SAM-dependent methyltransferase
MKRSRSYLMENPEEAIRLEYKTDVAVVEKQADWCGIKAGIRVLDVGCGSGKSSLVLYKLVQPGGKLVGLDFSEDRIAYARTHYGLKPGIEFLVRDFTQPLDGLGDFDLIWVRFVLEYNREESPSIIKNLTACLKPGGHLCLLDLDRNCLNHYELPARMEQILTKLMGVLEAKYNFDPYAGRKLYAYLYDLGYEDIQVDMMAHHLIYGNVRNVDAYNWIKKVEVASSRASEIFQEYPGGKSGFFSDFISFFNDPRRFTYTPLILCKGTRPQPD